MSSRALSLATVLLLTGLLAAGRGEAQENLDAGKTPSQIFAGTCTACHKSPRGLLKTVSPSSLSNFLRQHYTTSPNMAGVLASYLISNGATDTRLGGDTPKGAKGAKEGAKQQAKQVPTQVSRPNGLIEQLSRWGRKLTAPQVATERSLEGRRNAKPRPTREELPKEAPKEAPEASEAKETSKSENAAKEEGTQEGGPERNPDAATPSEEGRSQSAKVEQPQESPAPRPDPVPPVTPAPATTANEPAAAATPAAATPSAAVPDAQAAAPLPAGTEIAVPLPASAPPPPPAVTASTAPPPPPVAPAGPPVPPISQ
jgi:hypothetical protein